MRPVLLDLFCGVGGASMGYSRVGFDVVGVDIRPQPRYPFPFVQADAVDVLAGLVPGLDPTGFDAIHASPPCQGYSPHVSSASSRWVPTLGRDEPRLIATVRDLLTPLGVPWVIENVYGARSELRWPALLCGSMFGLDIPRHRLLEFSMGPVAGPPHPRCHGMGLAAARRRGWEVRDMTVTGKGRHAGTGARWAELLGITWEATQHELAEAIPPVYGEWAGWRLREAGGWA